MAHFVWDDSIALGIPVIDAQHKGLFEWIGTLNDAIIRGEGHEKCGDMICRLITYVTEHFSEEERLMLACNYPELASHRKEHDQFVEILGNIQTSFDAGNDVSTNVLDFMTDWLIRHIKGTDQGYSRYIHQQAGKM